MSHNAIGEILNELFQAIGQLADNPSTFDINQDKLLSTEDVCQQFRITRHTLNTWIKKGNFPAPISIGNVKRWPTSLINARIYEDNPQLRERENLMAQARKISNSETPKTREELDYERLMAEARRIAKTEKSGAAA